MADEQEPNDTMTDEVVADLNREIETLRKTVAAANRTVTATADSNTQLRIRAERAEGVAEAWRKAANARPHYQRPAWIMLILLGLAWASSGYVLDQIWAVQDIVEAHQCPPEPEAVECPPPVVCEASATSPTQSEDERGYWVGNDGMGDWHPWPDATGYPAARFEDDCHDVCAVPGGYGDSHPGRVLVTDPQHLVCICFHPDAHGSAWSVVRWVGWEHVR